MSTRRWVTTLEFTAPKALSPEMIEAMIHYNLELCSFTLVSVGDIRHPDCESAEHDNASHCGECGKHSCE